MPISAKELAIELSTDARTCRKFLRDITDADNQPGQGGRWNFEKKQLKSLKKKFDEWQATKVKRNTQPEVAEDEDDVEVIEDDEEFEELEDEDVEEI